MVMKKANTHYTFQQFNNEINEFYEFLKAEKYKDDEIKRIFTKVTSKIKKSNINSYTFLTVVAFFFTIYILTYFEGIYWHISAIGRIFLIKILPFFDWRYLRNKQCLIDKFSSSYDENYFFNCDLCENLKNIHAYEDIDEDILTQRYLELDVPVILTKGIENWPKNSNFIDDVLKDDNFFYSYPCKLSTNTQKGTSTLGELLQRVRTFEEFFLHFQNCDLEAMRVLRRFTYRPKYLPGLYSPVLYNWLVWNQNYNATNFKMLDLVEKVAVFAQMFGSTYIKLTPRSNCRYTCPVLDITLNEGESLVFTSLWELEYKPKETGENIAVILETKD